MYLIALFSETENYRFLNRKLVLNITYIRTTVIIKMTRSVTNALSWCYPAAAGVQSECSKNLIAKVLADETCYRKKVHVYRNVMVRNLSRLKRETDEMRTNIRRLWDRRKECRKEGRENYKSFESSQKCHRKRLSQRDKIELNILKVKDQEFDGEGSRRGSRASRGSVDRSLPGPRRPSTIARLSSIQSVPEEDDVGADVKSLDDIAIRQVRSYDNALYVSERRTRRTAVTEMGQNHILNAFEEPLQLDTGVERQCIPDVRDETIIERGDNYGDVDDNQGAISKKNTDLLVKKGLTSDMKPHPPMKIFVEASDTSHRQKSWVRLSKLSSGLFETTDKHFTESDPKADANKAKKTKPNEMSLLHLVRLKESQNFSKRLSIVDRISERIKANSNETVVNSDKRKLQKGRRNMKSKVIPNMLVGGPYQNRLPPMQHTPAIATEKAGNVDGKTRETMQPGQQRKLSSSTRTLPQLRKESLYPKISIEHDDGDLSRLLDKMDIVGDGSDTLDGGRKLSMHGVTTWRQEREDETLIVVTGGKDWVRGRRRRRSSRKSLPLTSHTLKMLRQDSMLDKGVSATHALHRIRTCHYPASENN